MTLSTESSRGYIIGSAYTPPMEAHKLPAAPEGKSLDDTARVLELKDDSTLSVKIGETTVVIDKDNVSVNGKDILFKGKVKVDGALTVTQGLTVEKGGTVVKAGDIHAENGDVKDGKSINSPSMSKIRELFDLHQHAGNLGAPTPLSTLPIS